MFIDLTYEFLRESKEQMDKLENNRTFTAANFRSGSGDVTEGVPKKLVLWLEHLGLPDAFQAVKKRSVNGFWLLRLGCSVVASSTNFPFRKEDVDYTIAFMRRSYRDQDLLHRVVTAPWDDLWPGEREMAIHDGLIVIDRTWVYEMDQESINPIFAG